MTLVFIHPAIGFIINAAPERPGNDSIVASKPTLSRKPDQLLVLAIKLCRTFMCVYMSVCVRTAERYSFTESPQVFDIPLVLLIPVFARSASGKRKTFTAERGERSRRRRRRSFHASPTRFMFICLICCDFFRLPPTFFQAVIKISDTRSRTDYSLHNEVHL